MTFYLCLIHSFLPQTKAILRIYPVYRKYKGISEEYYKDSIKASANLIESDYLPNGLSDKYNLMPYKETVKAIHFPKSQDEITKAQKRIVFDRMLYFASKVEMTNDHENSSDIKPVKEEILNKFISSLPYTLTEDQQNVISIIKEKMQNGQTCLTPKHGLMKKRNILYKGITRGKHQVTLIGTYEAFYESIDNNMIEDRHSMLAELIGISETATKPATKVVPIPQKPAYEQMALPFV